MNQQVSVVAYGGPCTIRIDEIPVPTPAPNEVRIRVEATCVSATDMLIRKGIYPLVQPTPPFALGYDLVGWIDAVGDGVTQWQPGQRVAAMPQVGGHATYVCCRADSLWPVPAALDAAEAVCCVVAGMTAYQMLVHVAAGQRGQRMLVHGGAGAVGSMLLQMGQHLGIEMVATASARHLPTIRQYGATGINYHATDYDEQLRRAAGQGFDAVFDAVSLPNFRRSWQLLAPMGKLVTFGTQQIAQSILGRTPFQFLRFGLNFGLWMLTLRYWNSLPGGRKAVFFGIIDSRRNHPQRFADDLTHLFSLVQTRQLQPLIADRLPLVKARTAHERLESGQRTGQLVLVNSQL
ncbi:medium chain dehydrogenase/reductase family protein [Fibrella aquatilis]|uniref:Zinc-binding dehydrogenase n=1 Tax=Fibrella aquatilis TaxID=2817059 RepID=A0A939G5K6_9BACT|nr:medium chain dehydrogenase/reductase family protein [Fibrella aquatilis]MBO0930441.1 zinc-binding dehydrogenase [Fibrella aquatilis]